MARSTGIGSMPGTDFAEAAKVALGDVDIAFLPEMPARGVHASMIGRTLSLINELGVDLQPDGWRVGVGRGVDQRRAASLLAHDLDVVEELAQEYDGPFKVQITGPLTLAASVEHPRGDKVVADSGARRELTEALAIGLADHISDVRRRLPCASDVMVQVDEPSMRAVLEGQVPTASGYQRHRRVDPPEADALLRRVTDVITAGGAVPIVHGCGPDQPVELLREAGFAGLSFDLSLARPDDQWGVALEAGTELWLGVISPVEPQNRQAAGDVTARAERFLAALGFDFEAVSDLLVITSTCGLAVATPRWARQALTVATEAARRCSGALTD